MSNYCNKCFSIYGAGTLGKMIVENIYEKGLEKNLNNIYDRDITKVGTNLAGITICYPNSNSIDDDTITVAVDNHFNEINNYLRLKGFKGQCVNLYSEELI